MIETERLFLRPFREDDRAPMAAMHADRDVMWDYGRLFSRQESDARIVRCDEAWHRLGFSRFAVLRRSDGLFLGYCGIMPIFAGHPMESGVEIGWRFIRAAWGNGYATEAARASLRHGFEQCGLTEIWSYTSTINLRSQTMMKRLDLTFVPDRGWDYEGQRFVVYVARA